MAPLLGSLARASLYLATASLYCWCPASEFAEVNRALAGLAFFAALIAGDIESVRANRTAERTTVRMPSPVWGPNLFLPRPTRSHTQTGWSRPGDFVRKKAKGAAGAAPF